MKEQPITKECGDICKFALWHVHCKNWKKCKNLTKHWNDIYCKECYDKLK